MKRLLMAAVLSTSCLALNSCDKQRSVQALPIPPDRMDCVKASARPTIPPEYKIDWQKVTSVLQARSEHDRYVARVRNREGLVTGYILDLEGRLFACSNDAQWLRDWQAGIAE